MKRNPLIWFPTSDLVFLMLSNNKVSYLNIRAPNGEPINILESISDYLNKTNLLCSANPRTVYDYCGSFTILVNDASYRHRIFLENHINEYTNIPGEITYTGIFYVGFTITYNI